MYSLTKSKEIVYCQAGEVTDLDAVITELARFMDLKSLDEVMSLSASLSLELDGFSSAGTDVVRGYKTSIVAALTYAVSESSAIDSFAVVMAQTAATVLFLSLYLSLAHSLTLSHTVLTKVTMP